MQSDCVSDPLLHSIRSAIRLYQRGSSQGITIAELLNKAFLDLAQFERYDLVNEVARRLPESAHGELRRLVEAILRPGATYTPFTIGRPPDPEAWRRHMIPACRRIATLFRQHTDTRQPDSGSTGT